MTDIADRAWQYESPLDSDNTLTAAVVSSLPWMYSSQREKFPYSADAGGIEFSVSDEQAVDSYNAQFTCSVWLPMEKARELRDWLSSRLEGK